MSAEFLGLIEPTSIIRAIEANLVEWYRLMARLLPEAEVIEDPDMVRFLTRIPHPVFNAVLCARFAHGTTRGRIEHVLRSFRDRGIPGMWWLGPTTHPIDLAGRLASYGFIRADTLAGMAIDLRQRNWQRIASTPQPPVAVTEATDATELASWALPFSEGFGMRSETLAALAPVAVAVRSSEEYKHCRGGAAGTTPRMRFFLGSAAGQPVASAMLFIGAGVAGLYGVATVSNQRNRGFATALVRGVLDVATEAGCRTCILHATPMAVSIYRRLGFVEYCRLRTLIWRPPES